MSRFEPSLFERAMSLVGRPIQTAPREPINIAATAIGISAALIRRFEGFSDVPYLCPAGVWTIGYGFTFYPDGRRVMPKDPPITREQANRMLLAFIEREWLPKVVKACPVLIRETPERLAAIIDFTFNLGAGNLQASTLRRRINEERWADVPAELMKWNKAGGRVLRGLTIRRQAESDLI